MNPGDRENDAWKAWMAETDPANGDSTHTQLRVGSMNIVPFDTDCYYEHCFTQVFQEGRCATNILPVKGLSKRYSYYWRDIHVYPVDIMVTEATSTLSGFKLGEAEKRLLKFHYSQTPFVLPAEKINFHSAGTPVGEGGNGQSTTIPFIYVKAMNFLFPTLPTDLCVFRNINQGGFQVRFGNRVYPERGMRTNSHQFYRWQREEADLDDDLTPTQSWEDSYLVSPATKRPYRMRSRTDNGDFGPQFKITRDSSSPFGSEPYHNPLGETVMINSQPLFTEDGQDTYLYPFAHHDNPVDTTKKNNTPPIIALISDTLWFFTTNGCVYETQMSWDDAFRKYFPSLHAQMMEEAGMINQLAPTRAMRNQQYQI
jgi:hypothetical protein